MKEQVDIQQFRDTVYQNFEQRGDAALDLLDALTGSVVVESPVALSENPVFRRQYSSVYDVLTEGAVDTEGLEQTWYQQQPDACETLAGYEVYGVDATPQPRPEAPTLADAQYLKASKHEPVQVGHKYSWVARLVEWGTSWIAPQSVTRIASDQTDSQCAVGQVQALAEQSDRPKVVVGDSLYCNAIFLAVFLLVQHVYALVRMRGNRVLYENPPPKKPHQKGRPRKHGPKFKLRDPHRPPEQDLCFRLGRQLVHAQVWTGLHFYRLAALVGSVIRIEFLRSDGTPRYRRPLWLFWSGPTTVSAADLCRMYLWRFAIEHAFRFMKQHLGLNANQSTDLQSTALWTQLCATAYYQLLLLRTHVAAQRPAWHPTHRHGYPLALTPRQVQRQALPFLLKLGTPARPPKQAGKGAGRPRGYQPAPRKRFRVVRKTKKRSRKPAQP
jgi:hypothetical protein